MWRERYCSDGPPLSDVHVGRAIHHRVIYLAPFDGGARAGHEGRSQSYLGL